jgi:hypothetical protein
MLLIYEAILTVPPVILQAAMTVPGKLESAGIAVQPKANKAVAEQEAQP